MTTPPNQPNDQLKADEVWEELLLYCDISCGVNADPADGFGYCTCGMGKKRKKIAHLIKHSQLDLLEHIAEQIKQLRDDRTDPERYINPVIEEAATHNEALDQVSALLDRLKEEL